MELILPLLGQINSNVPTTSPLRRKYVVKVTAEQISNLLQYSRAGRDMGALFRISPTSTIKIDKEIQRGTDEQGFVSQQPAKVREIAQTLLGNTSVAVPRLYLGALVWNIRPPARLEIMTLHGNDKPPEYRLKIDTTDIFLTDSAHRHLGIAESYRTYLQNPPNYPDFRPDFEFLVEIYHLTKVEEKELFNELNSKQKKISAAKRKELDVSSPIGSLKDAILEYDLSLGKRLFENNIEVSSNQNDRHTLMTMSVFVSSISEMFEPAEIKAARQNPDLRTELAQYYCDFSYALSETLIVRCSLGDVSQDEEVKPFSNLWLEYIKPVENEDDVEEERLEKNLERARDIAIKKNKSFRKVDISNHNAVVKAFYRIGGLIRQMPDWRSVIGRLQNDLVASNNGKFFQKENPDWFAKDSESDIPIASLNQDDSINVQVQSKNIEKIINYLRRKLDLVHTPSLGFRNEQEWSKLTSLRVSRSQETAVRLRVQLISPTEPSDERTLLSLKPNIQWKDGTFTGKAKLKAMRFTKDSSYVDPAYSDLQQWFVDFDVRLPVLPNSARDQFLMTISLEYLYLGGHGEKADFPVTITPID